MARRSRVEINRAALSEIEATFADGIFDIARAALRVAESRAPDAPPYGEGLVDRGAAMVYVGRKKTHQVTSTGSTSNVRKPRGSSSLKEGQVLGIVGFGFPAMFQELGTIHQPARPFLTPSVGEVVGSEAEVRLSSAMKRRLRGERDPKSAGISARIAAAKAARAARSAP